MKLGAIYFATVRIASIILQYYLLEEGIGLGLMATFLKVQPSVSTISPIVPKICLVFIAVSALRQAFWALCKSLQKKKLWKKIRAHVFVFQSKIDEKMQEENVKSIEIAF